MIDVTFFSSPIGLGHATRDIAIVQHLNDIKIKFVSGEGGPKLFLDYGFEAQSLYNPPIFEIENGTLKNPLRWLFKYYSYYKECRDVSSNIIEKEKPRLIVSDEDFASLAVAQGKKLKTVLITDILETNFVRGIGSFIEKKMNRSMKDIMKKCDVVIIPEDGTDEGNVVRVGPIVRRTTHSRDELRKKFSFDKKTVIISIGGTDAGQFLIEKTIEVFKKLNLDVDVLVVSGPSLKISDQKIRNLGFVNNLHEIIYAADLIISLAGKSTIDEAASYGTPGIFIPIKGHFEQEENAKGVGFSFEDLYRLESLIPSKINEKRNPKMFDGAQKAANIIRKFL
jgi:UDP-N-acetylglucosamine--N-acetylmuramyl-(pentapeptide) pyrophosphoryl-undecaprenol N-acetylglucosamine transferase